MSSKSQPTFWLAIPQFAKSHCKPALIIFNDIYNQYSSLLTVAPLSSNVSKVYSFEVYIPKGEANLTANSKIMIVQLRSIDKRRLLNKIGTIEDKEILEKVDRIIREHFNL